MSIRNASFVSLLVLTAPGCGLVLDLNPDEDGGAAGIDAATRDAGVGPGMDAGPARDGGGPRLDGARVDAPSADGGRPPALGCGRSDAFVVAHYPMEGEADGDYVLFDAVGGHDGTFIEGSFVATGSPCGRAFDTAIGRDAIVEDSSDFQLTEGSVDALVQVRGITAGNCVGIVSRDASGASLPGHFTIFMNDERRIGVRLQSLQAQGGLTAWSDRPIPEDEWVFVAVNFGPSELELYVGGVRERGADPGSCMISAGNAPCGMDCHYGVDGNTNPWAIGAGTFATVEGGASAGMIQDNFPGAVDEVRISGARRGYDGVTPYGL